MGGNDLYALVVELAQQVGIELEEPTFVTETVNGNYDADGDTDSADLDTLLDCFATGPTGAGRIFDDDGHLDLWDLFAFLGLGDPKGVV